MNSSFTMWYDADDQGSSVPTSELHINLWLNDSQRRDIIDFGLMIKNPKSIKNLFFYIPFKIGNNDIENLTEILAKNKQLSDLVFNEDTEIKSHIGEIYKVDMKDNPFQYYILDCSISNKLEEKNLEEGCLLKYIFDANIGDMDTYIRFRIKNIKDKGVVTYDEREVPFLSGTSNTLVSMEINFNEYRKLPNNINQKAHYKPIGISKINLFVMTDIHMEYTFSSMPVESSRILEKEKWLDYNEQLKENNNDKILAYQFKKKPEREDTFLNEFSIFNKFNNIGIKKPYMVLIIIFIVGILGSLTTTHIPVPNVSMVL